MKTGTIDMDDPTAQRLPLDRIDERSNPAKQGECTRSAALS
jgi:hypothetical protein